MTDITMSLDDTLELDAIIKKWNAKSDDTITVTSNKGHNLRGLNTYTGVFDPTEAGEHTIDINGQVLTVKVTDPNTIPDSVLTQDLMAWYRFENGDARDYTNDLNSTFADSTDYSGTISGAKWGEIGGVKDFKNGYDSGRFSFNGSGDYISSPEVIDNGDDKATICCWVRADNWVKTSGVFATGIGIANYADPGDNSRSGLLWRFNNGSTDYATFDSNPSENSWNHIAISQSDSKITTYYNGSSSEIRNTTNIANYNGLFMASFDGTKRFYDGLIDDVRIYNRDLTETEIFNIYNETKP